MPALEALRRLGGLESSARRRHGERRAVANTGADGRLHRLGRGLVAVRINPTCRPSLLFSQCSAERSYPRVLRALVVDVLLQPELRLGEGSGAAFALPLLRLARSPHNEMATFTEATVSDRR